MNSRGWVVFPRHVVFPFKFLVFFFFRISLPRLIPFAVICDSTITIYRYITSRGWEVVVVVRVLSISGEKIVIVWHARENFSTSRHIKFRFYFLFRVKWVPYNIWNAVYLLSNDGNLAGGRLFAICEINGNSARVHLRDYYRVINHLFMTRNPLEFHPTIIQNETVFPLYINHIYIHNLFQLPPSMTTMSFSLIPN